MRFCSSRTIADQVCMLTHQLGFPLPSEVNYEGTELRKAMKELGSPSLATQSTTKLSRKSGTPSTRSPHLGNYVNRDERWDFVGK